MLMIELQLGDIIRLKKQHPCGSNEWQVVRLGADIRIECTGCHRLILLERGIAGWVSNLFKSQSKCRIYSNDPWHITH
jgi:hypothetical protein